MEAVSTAPHRREIGARYRLERQRPALTPTDHRRAAKHYVQIVSDTHGVELWSGALRQQIYLGDADFVDRMQA
jgi:putative transposase